MAVVMPVTCTGVGEANPSTLALPSWPPPLPSGSPVSRPQHCTVPLAKTAHVWKPPPLTATAPVTPTTATGVGLDRKSTRLNSSHSQISYAVFCLKKKTQEEAEQSRCL